MLRLTVAACLVCTALLVAPSSAFFRRRFAPETDIVQPNHPGKPLIITDLLDNPEDARGASKVDGIGNFTSYAGFYRVNETTDNNLFVWYFPAQSGDKSAPLLIWLQGGPGGASTFGLFSEIGPFSLNEDLSLSARDTTWNKEYSLLFIDNPVGAGFSYTGTGKGYATNSRVDVARDLYELLQQFYKTFPDEASNDLYITGESYAGHYIPSIGAYIHKENSALKGDNTKINLAGISIGDGWIDPLYQLQATPSLMFNLGLADEQQTKQLQNYTDQAVNDIKAGHYEDAFKVWDLMLNGDIFPYPTYFYNLTGTLDYDNFLNTVAPPSFGYYSKYLDQPKIREAIHVGNATLNSGRECEMHLINDVMDSYKKELATLMNNYKVLIYNGNLDLIVGVPLTETFLPTVEWKGQDAYKKADRLIWKVKPDDTDVAGYIRSVGDFHQVVIRNAGHIVPYDQGRAAQDLITRFVNNKIPKQQ